MITINKTKVQTLEMGALLLDGELRDNIIFEVERDDTHIDQSTIEAVYSYARDLYYKYDDDDKMLRHWVWLPDAENDIDFWQWVNKDGKITKRIAKVYRTKHNQKLDDAIVSEIGNIIRNGKTKDAPDKLYLEMYTGKINWMDGEFGNGGSCWFGGGGQYQNSPETHTENGGIALRIWKDCDSPTMGGMIKDAGRVWVAVVNEGYILYNAYGMELVEVARTLSSMLGDGWGYKKMEISSGTGINDNPFINGDYGFLVSTDKEALTKTYYSLGWTPYGDDGMCCDNCGDGINEDDVYWTGDEYYCEGCFFEYYSWCGNCSEAVDNDSAVHVHGSYGYESMCDDCADNIATLCTHCDKYYHAIHTYDTNEGCICSDCFSNADGIVCDSCGDMSINDSLDLDHATCDDCYQNQLELKEQTNE